MDRATTNTVVQYLLSLFTTPAPELQYKPVLLATPAPELQYEPVPVQGRVESKPCVVLRLRIGAYMLYIDLNRDLYFWFILVFAFTYSFAVAESPAFSFIFFFFPFPNS